MSYSCSRKVPDGKLVNIEFDYNDGKLEDVEITGDFFIQPPEALTSLENILEGSKPGKDLLNQLETVDAELIGFSRKDIIECIQNGLGDEK